jgi:hypothetical protein
MQKNCSGCSPNRVQPADLSEDDARRNNKPEFVPLTGGDPRAGKTNESDKVQVTKDTDRTFVLFVALWWI